MKARHIRVLSILLVLTLTLTAAGCAGPFANTAASPSAAQVEPSAKTKESTSNVPAATDPASPTVSVSTSASDTPAQRVATGEMTVQQLLAEMTLDEKVGQMLQAERKSAGPGAVRKYALGSILSGGGSTPGANTQKDWLDMMREYQKASAETRLGIPLLYGVDAVHGHNNVLGAVVFPHNIGLGAANDPSLMSEIGKATAMEVAATGARWDFAPVLAPVGDIRWGRTYEGFSASADRVAALAIPYLKAICETGLAATAKHFIGDGATVWRTGDSNYPIDQGDARMSEQVLRKTYLPLYEKAVKAGVKTVMISFSSWNGMKNHENRYLITDVLKGELGFKGFTVSDWEAIHQIDAPGLHGQVVKAVNAGIDMLMEPDHWLDCHAELVKSVKSGEIPLSRIDDAVTRILTVKLEIGLLKEPLGTSADTATPLGSPEVRAVARKAVQESLVLLKNERNQLPLKKSATLFMTGPALNDMGVQCGGWTRSWQGGMDAGGEKWVPGTTILEGFQAIASKNGGSIVTDASKAEKADVAVAVLGEVPYAEGKGDDATLGLTDGMAHPGNQAALEAAKATGLPVVVILVSGRPRLVGRELDKWQGFVAAWLPGSEGEGVADVLYGDAVFKGTLPFVWPAVIGQADTKTPGQSQNSPLFPLDFGMKYRE